MEFALKSSTCKCHSHCAEQQVSSTKITKHCACHVSWHTWSHTTSLTMRGATVITLQPHEILRLPCQITEKFAEHAWSVINNGGRFENDPRMTRPWTRHLAPARSPRLLFVLPTLGIQLSTQISTNIAPATKGDTPTYPNTAFATKRNAPSSPNTAPATNWDLLLLYYCTVPSLLFIIVLYFYCLFVATPSLF